MSILVYAFVVIAAKYPFLLTSSLIKPPSPMSGIAPYSPFRGRPKKLLLNDLELSNLARNQIEKISSAKFFSTFVTLMLHGPRPWWPFLEKNLVFDVQEGLY